MHKGIVVPLMPFAWHDMSDDHKKAFPGSRGCPRASRTGSSVGAIKAVPFEADNPACLVAKSRSVLWVYIGSGFPVFTDNTPLHGGLTDNSRPWADGDVARRESQGLPGADTDRHSPGAEKWSRILGEGGDGRWPGQELCVVTLTRARWSGESHQHPVVVVEAEPRMWRLVRERVASSRRPPAKVPRSPPCDPGSPGPTYSDLSTRSG